MTHHSAGPPENGESRATASPALKESHQNSTNSFQTSGPMRQCAAVRPWRRRRDAADRCEPLGETANVRDPWRSWRPEQLSEKQIQAAVETAALLTALNLPPMFDIDTLRALWRAGFHALVDTLRGEQ